MSSFLFRVCVVPASVYGPLRAAELACDCNVFLATTAESNSLPGHLKKPPTCLVSFVYGRECARLDGVWPFEASW